MRLTIGGDWEEWEECGVSIAPLNGRALTRGNSLLMPRISHWASNKIIPISSSVPNVPSISAIFYRISIFFLFLFQEMHVC